MWKRIWLVTIAALALFSFASSRSYAQYGFDIWPDNLVLSLGGSYWGCTAGWSTSARSQWISSSPLSMTDWWRRA
jgi:hypothetical protein